MGQQRLGAHPQCGDVAASLHLDQAVDIREEAGRIIIEPVRAPTYDLDRLLAQMNPDTFPEEVDVGPPRGAEAW